MKVFYTNSKYYSPLFTAVVEVRKCKYNPNQFAVYRTEYNKGFKWDKLAFNTLKEAIEYANNII